VTITTIKNRINSKSWRDSLKGNAYHESYEKKRSKTPERKASNKKCRQSPMGKAKEKLRHQSLEYMIYSKEWRESPEGKNWMKNYNKEWRESPEGKAYIDAWYKSPKGKIHIKKTRDRRRLLGYDIINPEFANEPGFHGHHIDSIHVLYIPTEMHRSIYHSLKKPETMEKINTKAFAWLLGVSK
jgi:hypothetical protein